MTTTKQYNISDNIYKRYWEAYGGSKALFTSIYFYSALTITIILIPYWAKNGSEWWTKPLGILPNLFGFSLGGYAVWLSFGDDDFRKKFCLNRGKNSLYMKINATFAHFIILQISTMIYIYIASLQPLMAYIHFFTNNPQLCANYIWNHLAIRSIIYASWFIGMFLFVYSILCGLAATMAIFRFSSWYDIYNRNYTRASVLLKLVRKYSVPISSKKLYKKLTNQP